MAGREETGNNRVAGPGAPAPDGRASLFSLEMLAAIVAVAGAGWIVATTLAVIRVGYSPLPFWDEWDRWQSYLIHRYTPAWFFLQHNEHRLAAPELPAGHEITIDVIAEDKGRGWGQWQAVGWPHYRK